MPCPRRNSQQPPIRHANNHAHISEPAWPGQPIVATGKHEPKSPPSLAYFHTGPPLRSSVPCRFAFLREEHPIAALKPTATSLLYTPALRADLAPLANLATVHLANAHCHRRSAPCWSSPHASSTDRGDGVSSKRNLIHSSRCALPIRAMRAVLTVSLPWSLLLLCYRLGRMSSLCPVAALHYTPSPSLSLPIQAPFRIFLRNHVPCCYLREHIYTFIPGCSSYGYLPTANNTWDDVSTTSIFATYGCKAHSSPYRPDSHSQDRQYRLEE
jgi:hypothetical protein